MTEETGTLEVGEIHPAAHIAMDYINFTRKSLKLMQYKEAIASTALSGNRVAEVGFETLRRLEDNEPVSDRYLMGLGWLLWSIENAASVK
jgi:hypothetical protein